MTRAHHPQRGRCTPIDYNAVRKDRSAGHTWREIWREYATHAHQPYSYKWFCDLARLSHPPEPLDENKAFAQSEAYWTKKLNPTSRTLAIDGSLRVKGGCLEIYERGRSARLISPSGRKPHALVFIGWGGLASMPAIRWCIDNGVAVVALDWMHGLASFVHAEPRAEAALVRAQCAANPIPIAQAIACQKILHQQCVGCQPNAKAYIQAIERASTISEIRTIEGKAGAAYWDHRVFQMTPRGASTIEWPPFVMRSSAGKSPRNAQHPINAALNLSYSIAAGRLGARLAACGACLAIGFLHADSKLRNSLVWDAIEPLRPLIDARVAKFFGEHRIGRGDFIRLQGGARRANSADRGGGLVRIAPALARCLVAETALPDDDIEHACEFMIGLIKK